MSLGWLIALVTLLLVVIALVFSVSVPAWLPFVLIGALAFAIVLSPLTLKWPWAA